ncbi:MAG: hypothetical protein AAGG68_10500 [Bacteroidota bacterium]
MPTTSSALLNSETTRSNTNRSVSVHMGLGNTFIQLKDYKNAVKHLEYSKNITAANDFDGLLPKIYESLSAAH